MLYSINIFLLEAFLQEPKNGCILLSW